MKGSEPDEFEERARIGGEAQDMARDYAGQFRQGAKAAFLVGAAGVGLMWILWYTAGPEFQKSANEVERSATVARPVPVTPPY